MTTKLKKGDKVQVTNNAKYSGQDMDWTETFTGIKTIGKGGEWVTHLSYKKIKEFVSKKICVTPKQHSDSYFDSNATKKEVTLEDYYTRHLYSIYLPEGTEVETYSDDEYRFDLDDEFLIIYSGKILRRPGGVKIGSCNRQVFYDLVYSDTLKK